MKLVKAKTFFILIILLLGKSALYAQFTIPEAPSFQTSIYDYAALLTVSEKQIIEQKLIQYADSTSTQIVVATINSLNNDDINLVAAEWGEKWGVGQKEKGNGIFILISKGDRKMTIQNGYGIEPYLTDALSRQIIETEFTPYFKQGNYFGGIDKGTYAIFEVLKGTYKNNSTKNSFDFSPIILFIIIIVIAVIILQNGRNNNDGDGGKRFKRRTRRDPFSDIILTSSGRSSWGSGSSSGGSFGGGGFSGGFGGGSFGGGGASGSW